MNDRMYEQVYELARKYNGLVASALRCAEDDNEYHKAFARERLDMAAAILDAVARQFDIGTAMDAETILRRDA